MSEKENATIARLVRENAELLKRVEELECCKAENETLESVNAGYVAAFDTQHKEIERLEARNERLLEELGRMLTHFGDPETRRECLEAMDRGEFISSEEFLKQLREKASSRDLPA